ncbi:MAG: DUF1559 domain-containing protein, partial [Planctomycetia bacterium]
TIDGDDDGANSGGQDWCSGFRSVHPGGAYFLLCDGGVRFIESTIDEAVSRNLSTAAGGL